MADPTANIRRFAIQPSLMVSGRAAPQAPPSPYTPTPPPASGLLEAVTGSDWSMNISPREWHNWENPPARPQGSRQAYGGPEHRQYIANFYSVLDEPVIPKSYISRVVGSEKLAQSLFPDADGDDISMRQYLAVMPLVRDMGRMMSVVGDPDKFAAAKEQLQATKALYDNAPDGTAFGEFVHPDSIAAVQFLTGQRGGRESQAGQEIAHQMMTGLALATKGGPYESDPSMSQQAFDDLKDQRGEAAYRALTPGAKQNLRREQVLDFVSALSDDPRFQPQNMDTMTLAMTGALGGEDPEVSTGEYNPYATRFSNLMDSSAPRGRMAIANQRLEGIPGIQKEFRASDQARTEPLSVQGLQELTGHPAYAWGRTQLQYQPLIGDMGSRGNLSVEYDNNDYRRTPYQFFADGRTRTRMESPVRPSHMTPEEFKSLRTFLPQHDAAMRDWRSAHYGPPLSRAMNMKGSYFSPAMDVFANMPQEAGKGMISTGMFMLPVGAGAAKSAATMSTSPLRSSLLSLGPSVVGESIEETWQTPLEEGIDPVSYLTPKKTNAFLLPQDRGISPADKQAHDDALDRAGYERRQDLINQFRLFNNNRKYIPGTVPPGAK